MRTQKIYLASSWRNVHQPDLIKLLRGAGYEVYDFRNPRSGGPGPACARCGAEISSTGSCSRREAGCQGGLVETTFPDRGFSWKQVDPDWGRSREDLLHRYRKMLEHPIAQAGFNADFGAMKWADTCVLSLNCGRSAHIEFGWMIGAGKKGVVYMPPATEPCREPECVDGWVFDELGDRNRRCINCHGTGHRMLWEFEPELMYLVGGLPREILAFSHEELMDRLAE